MNGPCAKQTTLAVIMLDGKVLSHGTNYCRRPQEVCPRKGLPTGEGYEMCHEVCEQRGHAEKIACLSLPNM